MNTGTDKNDTPTTPDDEPEAEAQNDRLDNSTSDANIDNTPRSSTVISLGSYGDGDYLTKKEMCEVFKCGSRTIQRMVERFEIPPPMWLAGRKVWIVGNLRAWIADAAKRNEEEAARVAKKMRVFDY